MAHYDYRCRTCGVFEVTRPVHAAASQQSCPRCGAPARRLFTPPALVAGETARSRAVEVDRRSAHEPAVVTGPPPRAARPRRPVNPLHATLPRP